MAYELENKLVVAISSTALFNFSEEHEIYLNQGTEAFQQFQKDNRHIKPEPGTAFPFIKRLLHLNKVFQEDAPVEVIILSRNDPEAGQRMMDAMPFYGLDITRAIFLSGNTPYKYMGALNACLYLSTEKSEVREAVENGYPAGYVLPCIAHEEDIEDTQLRIAFDFDGVLVDDEAETKFADGGLPLFHHYELENQERPLKEGPLMPLFQKISNIQKLEKAKNNLVNDPMKTLRVSIVTARNAPAHGRLMTTLKHHGIETDELFLLGGIEKKKVLDVLNPQIFFDDQIGHLEPASENTPCVHIPFGIRNNPDDTSAQK